MRLKIKKLQQNDSIEHSKPNVTKCVEPNIDTTRHINSMHVYTSMTGQNSSSGVCAFHTYVEWYQLQLRKRKPFITHNVHTFSKFMVFWFFQIKTNWNVVKFINHWTNSMGHLILARHGTVREKYRMILNFSCFRSLLDSCIRIHTHTHIGRLRQQHIHISLCGIRNSFSCLCVSVCVHLFGSPSGLALGSFRHFFPFLLSFFLFHFVHFIGVSVSNKWSWNCNCNLVRWHIIDDVFFRNDHLLNNFHSYLHCVSFFSVTLSLLQAHKYLPEFNWDGDVIPVVFFFMSSSSLLMGRFSSMPETEHCTVICAVEHFFVV